MRMACKRNGHHWVALSLLGIMNHCDSFRHVEWAYMCTCAWICILYECMNQIYLWGRLQVMTGLRTIVNLKLGLSERTYRVCSYVSVTDRVSSCRHGSQLSTYCVCSYLRECNDLHFTHGRQDAWMCPIPSSWIMRLIVLEMNQMSYT